VPLPEAHLNGLRVSIPRMASPFAANRACGARVGARSLEITYGAAGISQVARRREWSRTSHPQCISSPINPMMIKYNATM